MTAAALMPLVALLVLGCGSGGNRERVFDTLLPPGSGPAVPPASEYRRVLHPYWLFLGFDRGVAAENWQISLCMRSRGWDRFPVLKGGGTRELPLDLVQTVPERRRAAMTYGARMLSPRSTGPDDLTLLQQLSDWLVEQSHTVRVRFDKDFSGGRSENETPTKGSCKARALERTRPLIPSLDPAVEARAGVLYDRYITSRSAYQRAEQAWRSCMKAHGFAHAGPPLKVWRPVLHVQRQRAPALTRTGKARLARALTRQAVAEHECARRRLDDVVRTGELRVVRVLAKEFPQYAKLLA